MTVSVAVLGAAFVVAVGLPSRSVAQVIPTNVQVDRYPTGSNFSGQYGDEPYVASMPDGGIADAWIGCRLVPTPPN